MKSFFVYKNAFYFCESDYPNAATCFNAEIYLSSFTIGKRILSIRTDKGWYNINLEKVNFTVFNHVNNWWIFGTPYKELEKGDLW